MADQARLNYIKTFHDYPKTEIWRLFIDGQLQQDSKELGFWGYESRQKGSVKGLFNAFFYIKDNIEKPLCEQTILDLHRLCTENVVLHKGRRKQEIPEGAYRSELVAFSLIIGDNTTANGLAYIQQLNEHGDPYFYLSTKPNRPHPKFKTRINDPKQIQQAIQQLIKGYHQSLKHIKKQETSFEIIKLIRKLIYLHPFSDGNCRTFATLLMNMLFIQHYLPITILRDPNCFRGYSLEQINLEVQNGFQFFNFIKKNKIYPKSQTTEQIIEHIKAKELITEPLAHWLASVDQPRLLKILISKHPEDLRKKDFYQNTPLITASYFGKFDNVKWICTHESEIDLLSTKGQFGATAIFWAAFNGYMNIVEYLIRKGVFISIPSDFGTSPLDAAAESGCQDCLKQLLNKRHLTAYTPPEIALEKLISVYLQHKKLYFSNSIPNTADRKQLNQLFLNLKQIQETADLNIIEQTIEIIESLQTRFIHKPLLLNALYRSLKPSLVTT